METMLMVLILRAIPLNKNLNKLKLLIKEDLGAEEEEVVEEEIEHILPHIELAIELM